jgi:hypothetical protein
VPLCGEPDFEQPRRVLVWQENGYPGQFADAIAASPHVSRAVIVSWNVNADQEFSYWENGHRVVRFD